MSGALYLGGIMTVNHLLHKVNFSKSHSFNLPQVQGTNDHATLSKSSTVMQGYYEDKFLQYFVSKSSRRAPIIHRSITYVDINIQFISKQ